MVSVTLKLALRPSQERTLTRWLWNLTGVWNWAIRKIELDARDGQFYGRLAFKAILPNHCERLGIPSHTIQGMLSDAHIAWQRCFEGLAQQPLNLWPTPIPRSREDELYQR